MGVGWQRSTILVMTQGGAQMQLIGPSFGKETAGCTRQGPVLQDAAFLDGSVVALEGHCFFHVDPGFQRFQTEARCIEPHAPVSCEALNPEPVRHMRLFPALHGRWTSKTTYGLATCSVRDHDLPTWVLPDHALEAQSHKGCLWALPVSVEHPRDRGGFLVHQRV